MPDFASLDRPSHRPAAPAPPERTGRRSWHRRASRPVSVWMVLLVLVVLIHPWLPQSRWLIVHMVTLGLVTTSILVWGQHFTEALLKTRLGPESRPQQVWRIRLLTIGVLATIAGMLPTWPWLVAAGALAVAATLVWYALSLGSQLRAALAPRFAVVVRTYQGAALLLPVGAVLGAVMAFSPGEPWQGRLLLAHQVINVLGFVGITVAGTLLTLWPTVLRTRLDPAQAARAARGLFGMGAGVLLGVFGALLGSGLLGGIAMLLYLASWLWVGALLVRLAVQSARQGHRVPVPLFPVLSIGAGIMWFTLALVGLAMMWLISAEGLLGASLLAVDVQRLTAPFVAGFVLQVLLGAMSHLLPVTMGGGPRATGAGLTELSRGAIWRVVTYNLALAVFVLTTLGGTGADALLATLLLGTVEPAAIGSITRVAVTLLAFVVLLCFPVLMGRAVRANIRERRAAAQARKASDEGSGTAEPLPAPTSRPQSPAAEASPSAVDRRALTGTLLGLGSVLGVTALGATLDRPTGGAPATGTTPAVGVTPTGNTTTLAVSMANMRFTPDVLEVPAGDELVIQLRNDDPVDVHDLVLATGATSGRLDPGQEATIEAGVISHDVEGWCSIVGHRAMGMTLQVTALGAAGSAGTQGGEASAHGHGGDMTSGNPLARVPLDLQAEPGADHTVRDARLPEAVGMEQRVRLEITGADLEIAPGVSMQAMTFGGTVVGPILRSEVGARFTVELVNNGSMGHSLDMHAGTVSPDEVMRTIPPGESLEYPITTDHAGIWLYHCSTMPMTVHLAAGMLGALIVPPPGLAEADREYVLIQSDHYLVPEADGAAHAVSPEKIAAERPDATVFNGHANQYVHTPLQATVGERVRLWVLAAGPSRGISFHVVGGVFDTVFKEGEYTLRPDNENAGGSQALDLAPAQGGFVELVFREPGTYTAVNHSFSDMERGARALIEVSA